MRTRIKRVELSEVAGVGRTGTYIAIDAMLESAEKIKTVFIQNYVQVMRKSRPQMIQKDDQYVFLHQAVMEVLVCGNTEIVPQDLRITISKLAMVHKPSKKTGYEQEFKRLELVTDAEASQEEAKQVFMPANVVKNRFPNVVPQDVNFTAQEILDLMTAVQHSQQQSGNGVIVFQCSDGIGRSGCAATIMSVIERVKIEQTVDVFQTVKLVRAKRAGAVHVLLQDSCGLIRLFQHLLKLCRKLKSIAKYKSDGIGRSGCVATIMSVIERVKIEQTVDVFQTVKLVRAKRPGAVNTLEQYMFCYKTVVAYLDSFSTYSNFAEC
ncbi:Receptor-type tyrosine-protein phosphatase F [Stylophora pistillata]|uniref:Receptor-type tyrosine-protein phosphatase F n=1 Tax=Stylophora pistillata TaxID=50429 RepID=A0A2B4R6L3_STYPI|nr:Receptor-type tyrosine-protein phosphatase F [Stylophora pistillata]